MKIKEIITAVKGWHSFAQIEFFHKITSLITIAHSDILEDVQTTANQKLEAIKWLNEFHQRIINQITDIKNGGLKSVLPLFEKNVLFYGSKNQITKNSIAWSLLKAYQRTTYSIQNNLLNSKEQTIILNALNEICSGAYAIDEEEFHTLIGYDKADTLQLWKKLNNKWVDKYEIRKDKDKKSISHTLMKFGQPIDENEEVIFTFEADNYTRASEIFNRFLGFEPYVPMPENITAIRNFELRDKKDTKIKDVSLTLYKPIKNNTGEWSCSYQITEIQDNALYSILGVDALQSIQLALNVIDGLLKGYNKDNENQIIWLNTDFELIRE